MFLKKYRCHRQPGLSAGSQDDRAACEERGIQPKGTADHPDPGKRRRFLCFVFANKLRLQRFAAVIMRIREPKTTALIFASGKMVVTGAKSEDDSKLASRKYARIIQKLGFNAKFTDFKIQNIVGSCDIKFPIRLEGLASKHHNFSSYEPELFPGLIYRMIKPKIVLLIFVSGKIVLTGAKVREEIYQAFEMIYPVLQGKLHSFRCRKRHSTNTIKISKRSKQPSKSRTQMGLDQLLTLLFIQLGVLLPYPHL